MKRRTVWPVGLLAFLLGAASILVGLDAGRSAVAVENTPPVADAGEDQSVRVNDIVYLHGSATDADYDPIVSWYWDFAATPMGVPVSLIDEGTPSPRFIPPRAGEYQVRLVVTDGIDESVPALVSIVAVENLLPVAIIDVDIETGVAPLTVNFDSSSSYDPEGYALTSVTWVLGDGSPATNEVAPTHLYNTPGTYTVSLIVRDDRNAIGDASIIITVLPSANTPPVADAGEDQSVRTGDLVTLQGSATDADGDEIALWFWQFDSTPPGSVASISSETLPNATFYPDVAGTYVVTLLVSDGLDTSPPDALIVTAVDNLPPIAVIDADVVAGVVPLEVSFSANRSYDPEGFPLEYVWNFDDGEFGFGAEVTHTFDALGGHLVRLEVYDERGAWGTATINIEVAPPLNLPPTATPTAEPDSGTAPLEVQFTANASDPELAPLNYSWDFGDGESSTEPDPVHVYEAGVYTAELTVSDGIDTTTVSLTIEVLAPSYTLTGFYQPVDMDKINTVKGGRTVPLKFNVYQDGVEITDPAVVADFTASKASCDVMAVEDSVEFTTTGGTSLRYDTEAGQFVQNWKTPTEPGCYVVSVELTDSTSLSANFRTR